MAAWQFDLRLLPRVRAEPIMVAKGSVPQSDVDDVDWWRGIALPPMFKERAQEHFGAMRSWAVGWMVYGPEDGTRLDVIADNGLITGVTLRVDVRKLDADYLESIVGFVKACNCVFATPTGHLFRPDLRALWLELELSPSAEFVHDPDRFIQNLRNRHGR